MPTARFWARKPSTIMRVDSALVSAVMSLSRASAISIQTSLAICRSTDRSPWRRCHCGLEHAAGDFEVFAGYEGGGPAGEVQNRADDFVRIGHPLLQGGLGGEFRETGHHIAIG